MARADSVGETLSSAADSDLDHDVIIVGGGAAGLSAATSHICQDVYYPPAAEDLNSQNES